MTQEKDTQEGRFKKQIMIVDDEPRNLRILEEILEDFNLVSASSGEECLERLKDTNPEIIFLDVMMPGIDGCEVCQRIKSSPKTSSIKVILLSGKAMTNERKKGFNSGADDYITKPFEIDNILKIVETHFQQL